MTLNFQAQDANSTLLISFLKLHEYSFCLSSNDLSKIVDIGHLPIKKYT